MSRHLTRQQVLEATRAGWYMFESPAAILEALPSTRRTFLRVTLSGAGGLLVAVATRQTLAAQPATAPSGAFQPHALLRVDPDDTVTIWASNPDMGEGTKTSLPMMVAEELDADWTRLRLVNAPLDRRYGGQGVGGSDAMSSNWRHHRQAGAVGRHLLRQAAATLWGVDAESCTTSRGVVRHVGSGRTATYGSLAQRAAALPVPASVPLKDASQFVLIGSRVAGADNAAIVQGRPLFGLDVRKPGMRFAAVAKSPVFGQRPVRVDRTRALATPGVERVVEIAGLENPTQLMPGVAVVATSTWAALEGRDALEVQWAESPFATESSASLRAQADTLIATAPTTLHTSGDVEAAMQRARFVADGMFEAAFVAHATLEPHNCTAEVRGDECWIEGPLQMPASGRQVVAAAIGIPPERVHVQSTRIGGGFGRRLLSDYAAEAAVVSKAIGAPVQIVDSRAGDLQHDYYRPLAVQRIRAGADDAGRIVAWDHVVLSCSRGAYRQDGRPPHSTEVYGCYVGAAKTAAELDPDLVPTRIANARLKYGPLATGVPTGAWRAPSHMAVAFAVESTIDEIARLSGRSPVDVRLELLGDTADVPKAPEGYQYDPARMKRVLQAAAERGGIGSRPGDGRARGIAGHFTFGSYCAHVVELSVDGEKRVTVHRVTSVVDCGQPVNLLGVEAQVEGGVVDALGAAFYGEVPIEHGRAQVANFDRYRLIRQREAPRAIDVVVLPSTDSPTGMGEIALPPVAPAVANAIAALTTVRLRQMPFAREGFALA